jgi:hypothetical protein
MLPAGGNPAEELVLFDRSPLTVGGFRLEGTTAVPVGRPTIQGFQEALIFAAASHTSAPYWIGALVAHAEDRKEWREALSQAMSVTGLERHTLDNLASLHRRLCPEAKVVAQSPSHAEAVAAMPHDEQVTWLTKSKAEGWTRRELRAAVSSAARNVVLTGKAETVHTVEVTVEVTVIAPNATQAQDAAWTLLKAALSGYREQTRVIAARTRERRG